MAPTNQSTSGVDRVGKSTEGKNNVIAKAYEHTPLWKMRTHRLCLWNSAELLGLKSFKAHIFHNTLQQYCSEMVAYRKNMTWYCTLLS